VKSGLASRKVKKLAEVVDESSISGVESLLRRLCGRGDRKACNLSVKLWRHSLEVMGRVVEAVEPTCRGESECLRKASRLAVDYMKLKGEDLRRRCGEGGDNVESATACVVFSMLEEFCKAYPTYCTMYASRREVGEE